MNPTALITGASRGIGRGIALELAGRGWNLLINYASNEQSARETASACLGAAQSRGAHIDVDVCQANIAAAQDRKRLVDHARSRFNHLHLLVNNAGIAPEVRADLLEVTEESFDRLMAVNVRGPFFLTQLVAKWMVEQAAAGAAFRGKIVTISSISAYTASTNRADYCISKAALAMLTPLYAARLAEHRVGVFEIRPGIIATDMTSAVRERYDRMIQEGLTPIQRWGTPEDVGKAVAAIAEDQFPFSTGDVINVDGGFHLRRL